MKLFTGLSYNYRGLKLGLKTPILLFLGLIRFAVIAVVTIFFINLVFMYHNEILSMMWGRPESPWIIWLWHLVSWIMTLILMGLSAVVSFLISQILFSMIIMDTMSRITERSLTGRAKETERRLPWLTYFFYLLRQEIFRAVVPVMVALSLMVIGWLTPLSPVLTVISSLASGIFLAWDNTDLVPARRDEPFGRRFKFLRKNLMFHIGFGLWFLIPLVNIVFLSFAPVGATLFYIEQIDAGLPQV